MAPDRAPEADDLRGKVPVVDLSAEAAEVEIAIQRACADWGFFHLLGHGLDPGLLEAALEEARGFFALPPADKRALSRSRRNPWGYYDRELTKNRRDKKEIFDVGPDLAAVNVDGEVFSGATPFPQARPRMRPTAAAFVAACEGLCMRLLRPIATGLAAPPDALDRDFAGVHTSFLRLNHYPTQDPLAGETEQPPGLGIHHHTDAGAITILLTDGRPGLEVWHEEAWRRVDPEPGGLIVNIGDMAQVWSNDAYKAPLHRVLAMESEARLSLAYFFNPAYTAMIAPLPTTAGPPRYRGVPWGEFRQRRADGDFADYGAEVQISDYRI